MTHYQFVDNKIFIMMYIYIEVLVLYFGRAWSMKWGFFKNRVTTKFCFLIDKKNIWSCNTSKFKVTPPLNDHFDISRQVAQTSAKRIPGQSNLEETNSIQASFPELGPVGLWSPKSSIFSGSDSIVVEEAARKFLSPR